MAGLDPRVGCSTITLRGLPLDRALRHISEAGFGEVDLGALPGVCDHVPVPLPEDHVEPLAETVRASGLRVRTVNADIGPPAELAAEPAPIEERLRPLVRLALLVGAPALTLPCGAHGTHTPAHEEGPAIQAVAQALSFAARTVTAEGPALYVEAPHLFRLCHDLPRARQLAEALGSAPVGLVLDTSHVVAAGGDCVEAARAFGERLTHVHLRDAVPGDIHRSIGRGDVDFAALIHHLEAAGYDGHYSLELETHDVPDDRRPAEAARAGAAISGLLRAAPRPTTR
ncbi:xylose isomerase [Streptomyces sp. Ru73]|nr:xylose isomerase [Streptomyces sp. Ru73]